MHFYHIPRHPKAMGEKKKKTLKYSLQFKKLVQNTIWDILLGLGKEEKKIGH